MSAKQLAGMVKKLAALTPPSAGTKKDDLFNDEDERRPVAPILVREHADTSNMAAGEVVSPPQSAITHKRPLPEYF